VGRYDEDEEVDLEPNMVFVFDKGIHPFLLLPGIPQTKLLGHKNTKLLSKIVYAAVLGLCLSILYRVAVATQ